MTHFVVARKTNDEYQRMIQIYEWCEANFGKPTYLRDNWEAGWHDNTEDLVRFTFFNDGYAALFLLKWQGNIIHDEYS